MFVIPALLSKKGNVCLKIHSCLFNDSVPLLKLFPHALFHFFDIRDVLWVCSNINSTCADKQEPIFLDSSMLTSPGRFVWISALVKAQFIPVVTLHGI